MINAFSVADALAEHINTGTYDWDFTAQVKIPRSSSLEELRDLQVMVLPTEYLTEPTDRTSDENIIPVSVGIQYKIKGDVNDTDAAVRSGHELGLQIMDKCRRVELQVPFGAETTCVYCRRVTMAPVFSLDHLLNYRVFTTVVTCEFWRMT